MSFLMTSVSVITAVGPYHLDKIEAVRATVAAQTVPCHHILVVDRDGHGAGWARNVGLARVTTPLAVFLDADDWLEPSFVERCLSIYDGTAYVYTDWWQTDELMRAPDCPWVNRTWHCITTLLPTAWARQVDGFDETLPGGEDTEFFLKLISSGFCGKRLPEPLFHYGAGGRRAAAFVHGPQFKATLDEFTRRYGGKRMACGDCGDVPNTDIVVGERQSGDILAQAIWGGNRRERGAVSGRMYPRVGNGAQLWVDPRDADYSPHLWRRVATALPVPVPVMAMQGSYTAEIIDGDDVLTDVADVARAMLPGIQNPPPEPAAPAVVKPNARKVRQLAKGAQA